MKAEGTAVIEKIDHIGIAVRKLEDQIPFYQDVLGLPFLPHRMMEMPFFRSFGVSPGSTSSSG
jgi:catechol 2,3-dioxygenase-like lactoylglutathione lyase family enzyme